jgi:hypothetical protein
MTAKQQIAAWKRAAAGGDAEAAWRLGDVYANGEAFADGRRVAVRRDRAEAIRWFRLAAESGDAGALCNLGTLLAETGRADDTAEGISLLKRAHRAGDACAAHNLALTYSELGNRRRCAAWLKTACRGGDNADWLRLGIAYAAGYGVRRDLAEAARLFRKAAAQREGFPCDREEARGFLAMFAAGRSIRVEGPIGRVHPDPAPGGKRVGCNRGKKESD